MMTFKWELFTPQFSHKVYRQRELRFLQSYFFRVLTAQGANAKGGAKNYVVDGKMTGGFAFVAWPAEYRNSGVMTFLIDQNGVVREKHLGPKTADIVKAMTTYNPDKTWRTVAEPDEEVEE